MAIKHGLGTYGNAVGTVTPEDHKLAQAGLVVKDTAGKIRPGLFWEGNETIVTGKANMSYDVARFTAALSRGASSGAVLLANDGVVNVVTTAAPGSNSRYDVVYVWQREFSLDGTDSNPVIGVVQGTAAASPTVPSLAAFPGAVELARILVPAGVTATNSGTTITQMAPFTAAAGAPVHFRNTTARDAETSLPSGGLAEVAKLFYVWGGSAWEPLATKKSHAEYTATSASTSSGVAGAVGTLTLAATETNDTGLFTIATNKLTVVEDGLYSISVQGTIGTAPTGPFWIRLSFSGVQLFQNGSTSTEQIGGGLMSAYRLPAGTVLEFTFLHTSAAARTLTSRIMLTKVGTY